MAAVCHLSEQHLFVDESFRQINAASIESAHDPTYEEQIELALLYEKVPDFVELINNSPSHFLDENLDSICTSMFMWDSGKCAAAVLDGQTKITQIPRAGSWLLQLHNGPLLFAAADNAPKITALLLQREFSADVRGDLDFFVAGRLKNVLPLHVILRRLSYILLYFDPKDEKLSAIKIVVQLCQLHIRQSLETLRLIALNTTELKREFFNYIKEGKMLEVGALLLVAKSQILSPSSATPNREFREFRSISEMHDFVLNAKCLKKNKNKLVEMEETLVLLRIFDKIGDKLAILLRHKFTPAYIGDCATLLAESLIEEAGFDVKNVYYDHSVPRSEVVSYFSKRDNDECEKKIPTPLNLLSAVNIPQYVAVMIYKILRKREHFVVAALTMEMLPSWLKEAVWRGVGDKFDITSRLTYPVSAASPMPGNIAPLNHLLKRTAGDKFGITSRPTYPVFAASPMPENMAPLHHLLKRTAPFLGMIKKVFRRI